MDNAPRTLRDYLLSSSNHTPTFQSQTQITGCGVYDYTLTARPNPEDIWLSVNPVYNHHQHSSNKTTHILLRQHLDDVIVSLPSAHSDQKPRKRALEEVRT